VLLITHEFPPDIYGGIGVFCYDLANALGRRGINVTVAAGCLPRTIRRRVDDIQVASNVQVVRLPKVDIPPNHFWYQMMNRQALKTLIADADVVHCPDSAAFPMVYLSKRDRPRVPWVVFLNSGPVSDLYCVLRSVGGGGSLGDMFRYGVGFPGWDLALRGDIRFADALVAVSESLSTEVKNCYSVETRKLTTIHNGEDIGHLQEIAEKGHSNWKTGHKMRIFCAGRLVWRKGVNQLIDSLIYLTQEIAFRDFELQLFGRGPLERNVRQLILRSNLKENVVFRGFVEYEELIASMGSSDVVCFPSLYEACPMGMIEAMALGRPVVAFDRPYSREMMGDDSELPLAQNIQEYAHMLHKLCTRQDLREVLGRSLQARARRMFDIEISSDRYLKLYQEVLANAP